MANNLYRQLNSASTSNSLIDVVRNSSNPYQTLMNMAKSDNRIAQIINEVNANGGDAKSLFYAKAKQMGVNPEDVLRKLR